MERLRYSDRTRLAEKGTLGPLEYAKVGERLRHALASIYEYATSANMAGRQFDQRVCATAEQHFGRKFYWRSIPGTGQKIDTFLKSVSTPVDDVLDMVEIMAEEAVTKWVFSTEHGGGTFQADAEIEHRLNAAFARYRFGYRIERGQIRRIGSPAMDEAVVGPALLALRRPGWEEADRSYRDALHHRRGGASERGAAITDAHAALESAMKAAGLKGNTLDALAKNFRNSGLLLPQLESVPEALDKLLKRSSAIRDNLSDAHGRDPGAPEVPPEVVDLAIHWTGAFIVYLAEAVNG